MESKYIIGVMDYVVIIFSLIVSVVIGIKFRYFTKKPTTMKEYVLAGKEMSLFPVIMSLSVTFLTSVTIIGIPMETYRYGMQVCTAMLGAIAGTYATAYIFTPVYFKCEVSTIYEFLELRFGKITRYAVSGLFIIQMVFCMSSMLYAPVLAMSAVTNISLEMSIIVFGLVCSFYCSIGGLKAVLWTDVIQAGFMLICVAVLFFQGISEAGGISEVFRISREGQRWNFLNLQVDFTTRYTLWNTLLRGFLGTMAYCGASQVEVQRVQSLSSLTRARAALVWSLIPSVSILLMCQFLGMIVYAIFYTCDPIQDSQRTGVTKYDQVIPYYIVTRLSWVPGLTGLCMAGIFSGSLSTISSVLNSLSTVTVVDFIKPIFSKVLPERRTVFIAKALSMLYGVVCIGMTFIISKSDSIVAVTGTLVGIMEGPMLAIFLVAVLSRKGSDKCIVFGFLLSVFFMSWIGIGSIFSGYRYPTLPLNSTGCPSAYISDSFPNTTCVSSGNCTMRVIFKEKYINKPFILYRISYIWITPLGCFVTLFFIFTTILLTGWRKNVIPADSKCLSPVALWWTRKPKSTELELNDYLSSEENTMLPVSTTYVD